MCHFGLRCSTQNHIPTELDRWFFWAINGFCIELSSDSILCINTTENDNNKNMSKY
jgi:hypothetical protein